MHLVFLLSDIHPPHRGHNVRPRPGDALALLDILAAGASDVSQYMSVFISDEPFILIYNYDIFVY